MTIKGIVMLLIFAAIIAAAIVYGIVRGRLRSGPMRRYYPQPDFTRRAGFQVAEYPINDILTYTGSWLLAGGVAGLQFRVQPDWKLWLRVAQEGRSLRLDQFDRQYETYQTVYYDGIRVVLQQTPGGAGLATWVRDGFSYALYLPRGEMGLLNGLAVEFVEGTASSNS